MRNITVSVPDDVYRKARVTAAERDTSVSALVREFLEGLSRQEKPLLQQEAVIEKLRNDRPDSKFDMSENLTQEQLHDRKSSR